MIRELIKKMIPQVLKVKCLEYLRHRQKMKIVKYLKRSSEFELAEKNEIMDYFADNPLSIFPYEFTKKYNSENVIVHTDSETMMKYVWHENKRLYFKKNWHEKEIQNYYNGVLLEQDINSPHRYETANFHIKENDIIVDAGAAEGNFALSVVEKAKKIYLFEVDEEWIEALKITFAPWKDKVEIVCKYVSDNDDGNNITLDTFFKNKKIDFIKADVEGAEIDMLKGCQNILSTTEKLKVAICTYHRSNDAEKIDMVLQKSGFDTEFSKGYMIFIIDKALGAPFLRRGLIYATKNEINKA